MTTYGYETTLVGGPCDGRTVQVEGSLRTLRMPVSPPTAQLIDYQPLAAHTSPAAFDLGIAVYVLHGGKFTYEPLVRDQVESWLRYETRQFVSAEMEHQGPALVQAIEERVHKMHDANIGGYVLSVATRLDIDLNLAQALRALADAQHVELIALREANVALTAEVDDLQAVIERMQ